MIRSKATSRFYSLLIILSFLGGFCFPGYPSAAIDPVQTTAASSASNNPAGSWIHEIDTEWGGLFKFRNRVSFIDEDSIFKEVDTGTFYDANADARLMNRSIFSPKIYFETHYEVVFLAGDTLEKGNELKNAYPEIFGEENLLLVQTLDDDRRLMSLTRILKEEDDYILYHRLDRLNLTLQPEWGLVRIGRQAVTWGNGLLFNPMDLINPFSPTDIERDYKIGDDMVFMQVTSQERGDFQWLYLVRRDPDDNETKWDVASLAGKLHFSVGTTEFDVMGGHHYEDEVIGIGSVGYLSEAAWRFDAVYTFLNPKSDNNDYLSLVANMDYSWTWWNKNFYGFIEFYYNGLGKDDPSEAFSDSDILERLDRGELFTLGKTYLGAFIQIELHPLVNLFLTSINNVADPSGLLQPRAVWDITQDLQLTLGGNVAYGVGQTEFGGFAINGTDFVTCPTDSVYMFLSCYF